MELLAIIWILLASVPVAFFAVNNCCCSPCQYCTIRPSQWQVVLSGVANVGGGTCATCTTVDGTYILPLWTFRGANECWWRYEPPNGACYNPDPFGNIFGIELKMATISGTHVNIQVFVSERGPPFISDLDFRKDMGEFPIDCSTVSGQDLPSTGLGNRVICTDAAATCTVTAIP